MWFEGCSITVDTISSPAVIFPLRPQPYAIALIDSVVDFVNTISFGERAWRNWVTFAFALRAARRVCHGGLDLGGEAGALRQGEEGQGGGRVVEGAAFESPVT